MITHKDAGATGKVLPKMIRVFGRDGMRQQEEAVKLLAIRCINGLLTETDISVEKHFDLN